MLATLYLISTRENVLTIEHLTLKDSTLLTFHIIVTGQDLTLVVLHAESILKPPTVNLGGAEGAKQSRIT